MRQMILQIRMLRSGLWRLCSGCGREGGMTGVDLAAKADGPGDRDIVSVLKTLVIAHSLPLWSREGWNLTTGGFVEKLDIEGRADRAAPLQTTLADGVHLRQDYRLGLVRSLDRARRLQLSEHHSLGELARAFGRCLGRIAKAVRERYSGDNRVSPPLTKHARERPRPSPAMSPAGKIPAAGKKRESVIRMAGFSTIGWPSMIKVGTWPTGLRAR
jgi:hypothetical protein